MSTSFYTEEELKNIGFASYGHDVSISRKASIYAPSKITIGSHVRIDDFCILSGKISMGDHVHIATHVCLIGGTIGIELEDFASISSRSAVYAASDDYSGEYLINPTIPSEFSNVVNKKVVLRRHVIIGTGSTILPGVECGEGVAVGAMSLVNKSLEAWKIYAGIPCIYIKDRRKELLKKEEALREKEKIYG